MAKAKNIWILNHYAAYMYLNKAGRHYWFAENLKKQGYDPTIFCASDIHNSNEYINIDNLYKVDNIEDIPFVFVKTPQYSGNGISRIKNMVTFFINVIRVSKKYLINHDRPDVILASSVHPLTLVAGIIIAKKFKIPCICEVRDLWPESIVEFGNLKRKSLLAKILYQGEKWIYKNADKIIFTMEGGKDYIKNQKWDQENGGPVDINKVNHINNGVDLNAYIKNIEENNFEDDDLDDNNYFKIIYTGSIRKANNIEIIINSAKYVLNKGHDNIKFIIYGDGDEKDRLQKKCIHENISNVVFKGRVEKKYVPFILSKSDLNILNYSNHEIWKYGGSQNKNFEYLASGKPILSTITMGYDIIEKYNAGVSLKKQDPETIGNAIISIFDMDKSNYEKTAKNARNAALDYDFKALTRKLIDIIESI